MDPGRIVGGWKLDGGGGEREFCDEWSGEHRRDWGANSAGRGRDDDDWQYTHRRDGESDADGGWGNYAQRHREWRECIYGDGGVRGCDCDGGYRRDQSADELEFHWREHQLEERAHGLGKSGV